jgi:bacillithiol system protein YtxJ
MAIEKIHDQSELESIFQSERAVLFKHSKVCGLSASVMKEVQRFAEAHSDVSVFVIDVRAQRQLSQHAASHLGIPHESPQAIVIRDATVTWHASHFEITAEKLSKAVARG